MAGINKSISDVLGEGYADTLATFGEKSQVSDNLKEIQDTFKAFMLQSLYTAADKGDYSGGDAQNILSNIPINLGADLGGGYGLGLGINTPSPSGDFKDDYRVSLRKNFAEGGLVSNDWDAPTMPFLSDYETKKEDFFTHLFDKEGGYSFDKKDPGGETNYGISKKQYPDLDIKKLDKKDARDIYERDFLPAAETNYGKNEFAFKMADIGINAGPQIATEIMQKALNTFGMNLEEDGGMGDKTRIAYRDVIGQGKNKELMDEVIKQQKLYYSGSKDFRKKIDDEQRDAYYYNVEKGGTEDNPKGGWFTRAGYRGEKA